MTFRPLTEADLPQLARWLSATHVQNWWGGLSDIDLVRQKYLPRIRGDEPTEVFVIANNSQDIGIIQRYKLSAYPDWLAAITTGSGLAFANAAGIDYLIAIPELTGQGTGTQSVQNFTKSVFLDWLDIDHIVVAPQQANRASCRVLEKAGYTLVWTGLLDSDDPTDTGTAALYIQHR